ncbi:two-component system catabolic regulation response regulator CreB [Psychrobacter sp. PL15]|jgi:two-component system catabolic regulation response regulator CreB|uniref:response regulator n=1 Tax=Psychrobacter sp. PL15 TaxID=3071719 RepID=UPI002DFB07FB|nr:two-component system catabolic regulation response regulator CreB [Psychrobacter sp. PL15]
MTHILLVEDDPAIAMSLKVTCKREGWQITWLDNASSVLPMLHSEQAQTLSAIILDVGLPDGDGLNLCQQIRHTPDIKGLKDIPVVFLTARSDEEDRILGLEMGGDDYCAKPFSPRELVARLKAIWRREQLHSQQLSTSSAAAPLSSVIHQPASPETTISHASINTAVNMKSERTLTFEYHSGIWHYYPLNYSLIWQDQKLELSNTERKLLLTLLKAPNQVFSRQQLLSSVSDYPDHRLARTIDSHIKSIRKQLASVDPSIDVIHTHRGLGYALCPA